MVTHIFKIPARARVPQYRPLPGRMRWRTSSRSSECHLIQHLGFWHIGEGETLGCKSNFGATNIFERPEIGAHAEIVCNATARAERQIPAAGSRWDVRNIRAASGCDPREFFTEED